MLTPQSDPVFRHRIPFPQAPRRAPVGVERETGTAGQVQRPADNASQLLTAGGNADVEAAMGDASTRNLVFRFWNLTMSQRREIALGIGLISEEELGLPEPERYGRALL
jgi:hypothetical protein